MQLTPENSPDAFVVPDQYMLKVVPPVVRKKVGETFVLRNTLHVPVHASFPPTVMRNPDEDIGAGRDGVFSINSDAPKGIYSYTVIVMFNPELGREGFTLQASGGSDPRIIID